MSFRYLNNHIMMKLLISSIAFTIFAMFSCWPSILCSRDLMFSSMVIVFLVGGAVSPVSYIMDYPNPTADEVGFSRQKMAKITFETAELEALEAERHVQGYEVDDYDNTRVSKEVQDIMNMECKYIPVNIEFQKYKNISLSGKPVKYSLCDDEYLHQPGLQLTHVDPTSLVAIGREVIPMLTGGFSSQGAGFMFLLAYNLKVPDGTFSKFVYNEIEYLMSTNDTPLNELTKDFRHPSFQRLQIEGEIINVDIEAAFYCYIAACTLRLYTIGSNDFIRAWESIQTHFLKIYGSHPPVRLNPPRDQMVEDLAYWYRADPRAKQTLYRLLYLGYTSPTTQRLRSFCVEKHIALTGLHLIGMFLVLCTTLNCDPGIMLSMIAVREFERQIKCITAFLDMLMSKDTRFERRIWMYGRIFDHAFFSDIQMKRCPKLVLVFACALRNEVPDKYKNLLRITHIASFPASEKMRCDAVAKRICQQIRLQHSGSDTNVRRFEER